MQDAISFMSTRRSSRHYLWLWLHIYCIFIVFSFFLFFISSQRGRGDYDVIEIEIEIEIESVGGDGFIYCRNWIDYLADIIKNITIFFYFIFLFHPSILHMAEGLMKLSLKLVPFEVRPPRVNQPIQIMPMKSIIEPSAL